jgi:hypothetical protein
LEGFDADAAVQAAILPWKTYGAHGGAVGLCTLNQVDP